MGMALVMLVLLALVGVAVTAYACCSAASRGDGRIGR